MWLICSFLYYCYFLSSSKEAPTRSGKLVTCNELARALVEFACKFAFNVAWHTKRTLRGKGNTLKKVIVDVMAVSCVCLVLYEHNNIQQHEF